MAASDSAWDSNLWCLSAFRTVRGRASPAAVEGAHSGTPRNNSTPVSVRGRRRLFTVARFLGRAKKRAAAAWLVMGWPAEWLQRVWCAVRLAALLADKRW